MKKALLSFLITFICSNVLAQKSAETDSSFNRTRDRFLKSLENKDLSELMAAVDDSVTMIFPDGDLMHSKVKYLEFNKAWFKKNWKISTEVLTTSEKGETGYSLVRYKYVRYNPDGTEKGASMIYLVLIFQKKNEQWLLVHNQHTKILL